MSQILQIVQVILFCMPVLTLLILGVVIWMKTVSVVNRRWYLAILVPLLLANLLAVWVDVPSNGSSVGGSWQFWLTLAVDSILSGLTIFSSRGALVYGVSAAQIEKALTQAFREKGAKISFRSGERRALLRGKQEARILDIHTTEQFKQIIILERFNEVLLQGVSRAAMADLRNRLPDQDYPDEIYNLEYRWAGALYIVLAVIFAVSVWVFFFEPRLIMIE